jgi:hypothetical protein
MLIQKVFHIRRPLVETQTRLSNSQDFSDRFCILDAGSRSAEGRPSWDSMSMLGLQGPLDLELLPTDDKNQVLFRSTRAEMELCGLMELLPVRDHLTEVQLTLDYEIQSPWRRALDRVLGFMNRRVNHQILKMKRQMEDAAAPERPGRFMPARFIPVPHPAR